MFQFWCNCWNHIFLPSFGPGNGATYLTMCTPSYLYPHSCFGQELLTVPAWNSSTLLPPLNNALGFWLLVILSVISWSFPQMRKTTLLHHFVLDLAQDLWVHYIHHCIMVSTTYDLVLSSVVIALPGSSLCSEVIHTSVWFGIRGIFHILWQCSNCSVSPW